MQPRDVLKIDEEYMKVVEVGLSTNVNGTLLGPINGIIAAGTAATHPTVSVVRGVLGTKKQLIVMVLRQEFIEVQLILLAMMSILLIHQKEIQEQEEMNPICHM